MVKTREKNAPEHKKTAKTKILKIQPKNISRTSFWSKITIWIRIWSQINRTTFLRLRKWRFKKVRCVFHDFLWSVAFLNDLEHNASSAVKFCIARCTRFDKLMVRYISKTQIRPPVPQILEAGGKTSTWFPPGTLVELIGPKNSLIELLCRRPRNLYDWYPYQNDRVWFPNMHSWRVFADPLAARFLRVCFLIDHIEFFCFDLRLFLRLCLRHIKNVFILINIE